MIKEAIKHLTELGTKPEDRLLSVDEDPRLFTFDNEGKVSTINPFVVKAYNCLELRTLPSVLDYIKSGSDLVGESYFLQIESPTRVSLLSELLLDGERERLAKVEPYLPRFDFNSFYDSEEMNIALQSKFIQNHDREVLLQILGNVVEENVKVVGDDGISQSVITRKGITGKEEVLVPNPVTLAPYRTFIEVVQPESKFIFRMKEGPRAAIFEADGGAWRNEAINNIKDYLVTNLKEEIESGLITILA